MQEIVAELLRSTGALGVWLLGPMRGTDPQELLASAVQNGTTLKPPTKFILDSDGYAIFVFEDTTFFAQRVGHATTTIVVALDNRASLGLIRLRVRNATEAIESALASALCN